MYADAMTTPLPLAEMGPAARRIRDRGFAGLVITETARNPFMAAAAAAIAAPGLHLATGVAVAFARSPMLTAGSAWELAEATGGRFRLGLGTQVRAHVTRRYGMEFEPPGPRMAEYLEAVRAAFAAFGGEPLDFQGRFWRLDLLPAAWAPGRIAEAAPPVDVAAVNPWMLRMAGGRADGVHVHPLNTPVYLRDTVVPEIAAGARAAGRDPAQVRLIVPCFTIVGDDEAERERWRGLARMQVAFYGSTPNYAFIFDQVGAPGTTETLRTHQRTGDMAAMAATIDDELLSHFVVECSWDELAGALVERFEGIASRVVLYFANPALCDEETMARFGAVAAEIAGLTGEGDPSAQGARACD